ncbi:hypothetical protein [Larkinella soli]|uniref:hypothetical protein n=1 Tax=Larkinella soli TaxID=1770527 RepID=UPI000FFC688D|nr:hypothetical protein [Larkinella soli]
MTAQCELILLAAFSLVASQKLFCQKPEEKKGIIKILNERYKVESVAGFHSNLYISNLKNKKLEPEEITTNASAISRLSGCMKEHGPIINTLIENSLKFRTGDLSRHGEMLGIVLFLNRSGEVVYVNFMINEKSIISFRGLYLLEKAIKEHLKCPVISPYLLPEEYISWGMVPIRPNK